MADPNVVAQFKRALAKRRAGPKVAKALFEAGITESGLRNLNYGDRDSKGALQQRASTGWKHATDPYRAALDFLAQAQPLNQRGFKGSAGQLAQAVQRSAFPGRYDQNSAQADKLLGSYASTKATPVGTTYGRSVTTPGVDNSQARGRLLMSYLQGGQGNIGNVFTQLAETRDVAPSTKVVYGKTSVGATPTAGGNFAKSHSPLKELFWQGAGGVDAKNGAKVPQGFVEGHQDHVHVAAGPKTVVELGHIAQQKFGLHVGENPHFGGVHPVHATHSYHYRGEAIDVSGSPAKMRAFAHYVARLYGIK